MNNTSVVVVTYRRLDNIFQILEAWMKQSSDVWLCDCSAHGVKIVPPGTHVIRFRPDPGNRVRHAVATLTAGDYVVKADDDVLPKPEFIHDMMMWASRIGPAILGVHGRTFKGPDYYRDTVLYSSKHSAAPVAVDFVGVCTFTPRAYLSMDLRHCLTEIEDLFWQMECFPNVRKFVIPTLAYENLPESRDDARLCGNMAARKIRREYYQRLFLKNYSKRSQGK